MAPEAVKAVIRSAPKGPRVLGFSRSSAGLGESWCGANGGAKNLRSNGLRFARPIRVTKLPTAPARGKRPYRVAKIARTTQVRECIVAAGPPHRLLAAP